MILDNVMPNYKTKHLTDKTLLRTFFYQDRPLTAYALGDLEEDNWEISTFTGAFNDDTLAGVSLLWNGTETPVFIAVGAKDAVRALLADASVPDRIFFMVPAQLVEALHTGFDLQETRNLWRMVVRPAEFIEGPSHSGLRRLTRHDAEWVKGLFANDPMRANRIKPSVIENGVFYGIEDKDGGILALAGTHIYAESEGVGVVGYVYTAPAVRGRGLATATTGAVTRELINRGIDHVVLNVEQDNTAAVRSYQKLGFRIHAPIADGLALRKQN